jgi:hypothetical protein
MTLLCTKWFWFSVVSHAHVTRVRDIYMLWRGEVGVEGEGGVESEMGCVVHGVARPSGQHPDCPWNRRGGGSPWT